MERLQRAEIHLAVRVRVRVRVKIRVGFGVGVRVRGREREIVMKAPYRSLLIGKRGPPAPFLRSSPQVICWS